MERVFQHLELSRSEVERACQQYFKNKGSLQKHEILSGGAVNTTFKICWDGEWFVLRFYVRDKNLVSLEKQIYQIVNTKVSVPEMLFSSSNNEVYPFAIFRFCYNPHIYEVDKIHSQKLSYNLGYALSRIHGINFPKAGLFGKDLSIDLLFVDGSSPYFEYCINHLIPSSYSWKRLGKVRAMKIIEFIEKHRDFFPVIRGGGCLVHSDFKPVNLLWNIKSGLTVLDWEFAHSGHSLFDFGILIRHFQDFPLNIVSLEKGYLENGGSLSSNWIQQARITDFVNIIQLLNIQANRPKLFTGLIESIDLTIAHWETLPIFIEKECFNK